MNSLLNLYIPTYSRNNDFAVYPQWIYMHYFEKIIAYTTFLNEKVHKSFEFSKSEIQIMTIKNRTSTEEPIALFRHIYEVLSYSVAIISKE